MPEETRRLRWWQEEKGESDVEAAARAIEQLAAPAPVPEPLRDVGEELEAEARVRAAEAKRREEESVSVYYEGVKSAQMLRRFRRISFTVIGLMMGLFGLQIASWIFWPHHNFSNLTFLIVSLSGPANRYELAKRRLKCMATPAITLTPEGLGIDIIGLMRPHIPWRHIVNIEARRVWGGQAVCLTLKRPPIKPGRKPKLEYIYLAEDVLPISATALVARIAAYEAARLKD